MRTMRSIVGLIAAAIPVLYCGGLLLYFAGVEKWTGVPVGNALGPTMIGLGVVGLLFLIPLVLRIVRLLGRPGASGSDSGGGGRAGAAPQEERSDFDPEAAINRYLAKRATGAGDAAPPLASHRVAGQAGFGRKGA
jgi:hypothetical protein